MPLSRLIDCMTSVRRSLLVTLTVAAAGACRDAGSPAGPAAPARVPLSELGAGMYKGFTGGLYPSGSNSTPAAHAAAGITRAQGIVPLDTAGASSPSGKIVLLSIGMSNTTQEFCAGSSTTTSCTAWSFMGQAAGDAAVSTTTPGHGTPSPRPKPTPTSSRPASATSSAR